jgi:hypothetical protein|tara:strand:+ start:235 stop:585 length:351 start_codon:yes stop_codon:yes gene_type:complete
MEELISHVFAMRDAAHKAHWATDSYSQHQALGAFYDGLIDIVDPLVEAYQGLYGLVGNINPKALPKGEIKNTIKTEMMFLMNTRSAVSKNNPTLENMVDALIELYMTTLYKLTNLK